MICLSNGLHNIQNSKSLWCIQWNISSIFVITYIIFYSFIFLLIYLIGFFCLIWHVYILLATPTYVTFVPTPSGVTFTGVRWRVMWKTYAIKAAVFITDICRKDKKKYTTKCRTYTQYLDWFKEVCNYFWSLSLEIKIIWTEQLLFLYNNRLLWWLPKIYVNLNIFIEIVSNSITQQEQPRYILSLYNRSSYINVLSMWKVSYIHAYTK